VLTVAKTLRLMMTNLPELTKKKKITINFILSIITKVRFNFSRMLIILLTSREVDHLKIWKTIIYEYLVVNS